MPNVETCRALLAKVEEAKGGSRELDEAIHGALLPDDPWWQAIVEGRRLVAAGQEDTKIDACNCNLRADSWADGARVKEYTTSIDAALALVAKVLPGQTWAIRPGFGDDIPETESRTYEAGVGGSPDDSAAWAKHDTPALAILAALLRALLQQSETAHVER